MAIYAVGDVQGCLEDLLRLLDVVKFDPAQDQLWLTGDLVNRGPDSLGTLRFVQGLGRQATTVLGNHDLHLLAVAANPSLRKRKDSALDAVLKAKDRDELLDWLRGLPLLHHDPVLKVTLVHAGLAPTWDLPTAISCAKEVEGMLRGPDYQMLFDHMYGDQPRLWHPKLTGWDRLRFIVNCFTRLRFCSSDGGLVLSEKRSPAKAAQELLPWFQVPERQSRGQRILFGHWSTLGRVAWEEEAVWGLDAGCVWGGSLCALRIDPAPWAITRLPCPTHQKNG
jgi:bis(5'-nucleosyl)-tetraphosphatase (symmetrical)